MDYVRIRDTATERTYILLEQRLTELYPHKKAPASGAASGHSAESSGAPQTTPTGTRATDYVILSRTRGAALRGLRYKPLFPYYAARAQRGAFVVLTDTYVTADSGTGVVHQAPYFGEDDYRVCLSSGIIDKDDDMVCPVDAAGRFTEPVADFLGVHVKDADKMITQHLKKAGRLVHHGTIVHSYPFCWRSETPLIYKAVPCWFVKVETMIDRLLANNAVTNWVPDYVKERRFHNWLSDARDWAISRNRFWGTPIPIWTDERYSEVVCVGSIEELCRLSGVSDISDLHRDHIDDITIPSRRGDGSVLRRIPEVFDCWFESGSMPYAQCHYPFEHQAAFEASFPADFIAEGLDQTRGWFYTLLVISTALFDKPPFKNVIVNGLVLAADGQKMSKSKKNYPNPMQIADRYGADALRLYLINSPAVRAEPLRFREEGVRDIVKDVLLPWLNAFRFFVQAAERRLVDVREAFRHDLAARNDSRNIMDRWMLSYTHRSLISYVAQEMDAYRLYAVVPRLLQFIENLTNWYLRFNRRRIKGDAGPAESLLSMNTLFEVLYTFMKLMAPLTPFLTEFMFQHLRRFLGPSSEEYRCASVHFLLLPKPNAAYFDADTERAVTNMQSVIELGRVIRERKAVALKYPLSELVVIHRSAAFLADIQALESYIMEELNVRSVTVCADEQRYGLMLKAEPDHRALGQRLKGAFKRVCEAIGALSQEQLRQFQRTGVLDVCGVTLDAADVRLTLSAADAANSTYEANSAGDIVVLLDVRPSQEMVDEGVARELVNRVQRLRKKAKLTPTDVVLVAYELVSDNEAARLAQVLATQADHLLASLKQPLVKHADLGAHGALIADEVCELKSAEIHLWLYWPA